MNFRKKADELKDVIVENRRYFHKNAELSYKEFKTTAYLVEKLEGMGIPVQTYPDYMGCIATIKGGKPGDKTVLLRADIDALPIQENSGVSFESINPGVMHACGHDAHTAMLLGAAQLLWEEKENLHGTVKLLFQSAEEEFFGSHYYVDEGHLDDVDAAMGIHVWADEPNGILGIKDGQLMSSCDNFKIIVHGVSTHGSTPQHGRDAIVAASSILVNLQTIVSRINDPLHSLVVSIGTIKAGTQFNIITDTAEMEGTVRTHSKEARLMVEENMRRIVESTAIALGCTAELQYTYIEPSVSNDDYELNEVARESARKLYGEEILKEVQKVGGSEDFSYIMEKIPSSLFVFLGCRDEEKGCVHALHNEKFKLDEDILPIGTAEYAQFAADYLEKNAGEEKA